jgi:hypothetical protein
MIVLLDMLVGSEMDWNAKRTWQFKDSDLHLYVI